MKKLLLLICAFAGSTMHASEAVTISAEAAQAAPPAARMITPVEQSEIALLNKYMALLRLYVDERVMLCSRKVFTKKVKKKAKLILIRQTFRGRIHPGDRHATDKKRNALNVRLKALLSKVKYTHFYDDYSGTMQTMGSQEYFNGETSGPFKSLAAFKKALNEKQYEIAVAEDELKEMNIQLRELVRANK